VVRIAQSCEFGGGLFRPSCGREAVAECVYCGQPFCADHGERGPDYTDACNRKSCAAKARDVADHLDWKRRSEPANRISVCAHQGCQERMHHACSRCRLLFCAAHVSEQTVLNRRTQPPRKELALVCVHCRERRKLWG